MQTLQISLLGDFRLIYGSEVLTSVNTPRLQALLVYLLLHRQAPQARQQIAFQFWPASSEKQAHTNLRKLLFQLRNALPDPDRFISQDHLTVQWRPDAPYTLDVAELTQGLARYHCGIDNVVVSSQQEALTSVLTLYQGELLPGCYDDWLLPIRQQLHREVMNALASLVTLLENQRAYRAGIDYARRLLAFDPLEEKSYQRLMRLHALDGDYSGALRVYQDCVAVLQRELDVEPDAETQVLYERLRRREDALMVKPEAKGATVERIPLVGRQQEWGALQNAWRQAVQGRTHFVCIWGEAGIGKTRLAEELLTWADTQGIRTAHTRSYEAEGGLAYAPITEWLRSVAVKPGVRKLDKVWLSEIARLLPELLSEQPSLTPPTSLSEAWQRQRFFEALARAILIDKSPLLLVIDDLQWCDSETITWLRFLLRFAPQARLLIVGMWRNEAVDENHPLQTLLRDLANANQVTTLDLTMLNDQETVELAQQVANHPLAAIEMRQLFTVTEGHPLFIVETVRAQNVDGMTALPAKVQNVILSRLRQLSTDARELAELAATTGRRFNFAVIRHASQSPEETLVRALDELWQRRIVRELGNDDYDFSHDRIREVAHQSLSTVRRRLLHRRVAEALETISVDRLDEVCGELAEHYWQGDNRPKATHYLQRAGERAAAHYVTHTAVDYFTRALALLPETSYAARFPLLLARAKIANHQGKRAEGKRDLDALEQMVAKWDDGTAAALRRRAEIALLRADFGRGISDNVMIKAAAQVAVDLAAQCGADDLATQANFMWGYADFWEYDYFAQARPRLELALSLAQATKQRAVEADIRIQLAVYGLYTGELVAPIEAMAQEALRIYQELGNPAGEAGALSILAYIIYTQREGDYERGIRICEQAMQIQCDGWDAERFVMGNLAFIWYYQGDYRRAKPLLERQVEIARSAENWGAEAGAEMELGCLYFAQGDYGNALQHLGACINLSRANNARQQYRVKIEGVLALFYLFTGDLALANAHGAAAVQFARKLDDPRIQGDACTRHARVLVNQGKLDEAADLFRHALVCFRRTEQHNHATMPLVGLAAIALRQNDSTQAQRLIDELLAYLQTHQLDRTDEELYVYMTSHHILTALNDPRALDLLQMAYAQLQVRAASLDTESARQMFWSAPPHAEVLAAIGKGV